MPAAYAKIDRDQLKDWRIAGSPFVLVDTMPDTYFAIKHIAGAVNACVYEMAFLDKMAELVPDKAATVVVYAASKKSRAGQDAAERLAAAGWSNVHLYKGGMADWEDKGLPLEGEPGAGAAYPKDRCDPEDIGDVSLAVDTAESALHWTGRNMNSTHRGAVAIKEGEVAFKKGVVKGGRLVLDMTRVENFDLEDPTYKNYLVQHLMSVDFFEAAAYPEAVVTFKKGKALKSAPGRPNQRIEAELTLKGVTKAVEFEAQVECKQGEGGGVVLTANTDIDRTEWNVLYGSGSFYEMLSYHLVHDMVGVEARLLLKTATHS